MNEAQRTGKKGLHPLAWVAIGCGGLAMIGLVILFLLGFVAARKAQEFADESKANPAMAMAKMMVRMNPEMELVDSDSANGTLEIRKKDTGETVVVHLDELEDGRIRFTTDEGEIDLRAESDDEGGGTLTMTGPGGSAAIGTEAGLPKNLPDWVPVYPGGTPRTRFAVQGDNRRNASFSVTTSDGMEEVEKFYREAIEDAGLTLAMESKGHGEDSETVVLTARSSSGDRTLQVLVSVSDRETMAAVTFAEEN